MDTTTAALLTGVMVAVGRWTEDKGITVRIVVGLAVMAIMLSVISQGNEKLARQFGLLIVVGATFRYGPAIVRKVGLAS